VRAARRMPDEWCRRCGSKKWRWSYYHLHRKDGGVIYWLECQKCGYAAPEPRVEMRPVGAHEHDPGPPPTMW